MFNFGAKWYGFQHSNLTLISCLPHMTAVYLPSSLFTYAAHHLLSKAQYASARDGRLSTLGTVPFCCPGLILYQDSENRFTFAVSCFIITLATILQGPVYSF